MALLVCRYSERLPGPIFKLAVIRLCSEFPRIIRLRTAEPLSDLASRVATSADSTNMSGVLGGRGEGVSASSSSMSTFAKSGSEVDRFKTT